MGSGHSRHWPQAHPYAGTMPPTSGFSAEDDRALHDAKALLREAVLLRRETRPSAERRQHDADRFELIRAHLDPRVDDLRAVALYLSAGVEPATLQLIAWCAAQDIGVLLPVLSTGPDRSGIGPPEWAPYAGPDGLRIGPRGIMEPTTDPLGADSLHAAQLIFAPALAANEQGDRLGRGGGWYDRALQHADPDAEVWVLLNDDEVLDVIPTQEWDRPIDVIATPARRISCQTTE